MEGGLLLWNKDFQSPPSKQEVFNEWFGTFSYCPKKVS